MKLAPVDVHCHLLPGVDDGFRDSESSLKAIRTMAGAGCSRIIFTPHMNPDVYPEMDEAGLKAAYEAFVPMLPEGVKTHLAAEYMVVNDFDDRDPSELLTYPDGSILIEMSYYFRSRNLEQSIFNLNMAGLKPILAHPERYPYMVDCLGDFDKLADMGCRFQLNYRSLTGKYGKPSIQIIKYLMKRGLYSYIATDLHSCEQLDFIMKSGVPLLLRKGHSRLISVDFPDCF